MTIYELASHQAAPCALKLGSKSVLFFWRNRTNLL